MESGESFRVDFGRAQPLFPLGGVTILPQSVAPLHIFEPRYVQMVSRALDSDGLIVMATLDKGLLAEGPKETFGEPAVLPAVCVGRIAQHHLLPDGRFNILLQGVCRARLRDHVPADGETLYRRGLLEPTEVDEEWDVEGTRAELERLFSEEPLSDLCAAESVAGALGSDEAPTRALLELIAISVLSDEGAKYRMLEEGRPSRRAGLLLGELGRLREVLTRARGQRERHIDQPRGVWLN